MILINLNYDGRFDIALDDEVLPTLERIGVKEMGLKCLLTSVTGDVLGRGVLLADFQEFGTWRLRRELFKMLVTSPASIFVLSFNTHEGMPSGPDALLEFRVDNFFITEISDI